MPELNEGDRVRLGDFPAITFIKEHFATDAGAEGTVIQKMTTALAHHHVEYLVYWDNNSQFWVNANEIELIVNPKQLVLPDTTPVPETAPVSTPLDLSDDHRFRFEELGIDLDVLEWVLRHRAAIRRHSITQEHPAANQLAFSAGTVFVENWHDMSWQMRLGSHVMSIIEMASALTEFAREE